MAMPDSRRDSPPQRRGPRRGVPHARRHREGPGAGDLQPSRKGETVGVVGESGSGKSVTALAVLGLLPAAGAGHRAARAVFGGLDLLRATARQLEECRGREVSMIFQNPRTALNPIRTVGQQIVDVLARHASVLGVDAPAAAARAGQGRRAAGARADPRPRAPLRGLSLRAVGRDVPARDDRPGPGLLARAPHRRRADHGHRRDHPGRHPRSAARAGVAQPHGHHPDHPRPRRGGRALRPDRRHARRATWWRRRPARELFARPRHPVHGAAHRVDAAARAPSSPTSCRSPARCPTCAAPSRRAAIAGAASARSPRCDAAPLPRLEVAALHRVACHHPAATAPRPHDAAPRGHAASPSASRSATRRARCTRSTT